MGSALDNGHFSPNNGFKLTANSAAQSKPFLHSHFGGYCKFLSEFKGCLRQLNPDVI